MSVFLLDNELLFPDPRQAREDGLLAVGGDLRPDRLLLAYECGIFPWYSPGDPVLWWSPDPRCVLFTDELKVSRSMRNVLNRKDFEVTFDQEFENVMLHCQQVKRKDEGTWISDEIVAAYCNLFEMGSAHSVEVWKEGQLVGGLYGVSIGRMFSGESMFALESNASKVGLVALVNLARELRIPFIDCQIYNDHLGSLGARNISRDEFLRYLEENLKFDSRIGSWTVLAENLELLKL